MTRNADRDKIMSFSGEVKQELSKQVGSARHCQLAELSAIMHFCGQYGRDAEGFYQIGLHTENEWVVSKCFTLLKRAFQIEPGIPIDEETMRGFLQKIGEMDGPVDDLLLKNSCCQRAFLRGAFLCAGSMSDPKKGYHLEFVCDREDMAKQLQSVMQTFEINAKIVRRKKYFVVYLKESEEIVDLLNVCEAHVSLMNLENLRILKDVSNSVNRRVNCETANIGKTVRAATRQIRDIEYLRDSYGLSKLPESLRQMAEVRLENPDMPLKELGQLLDPPVGKSGVNHRLRKLEEIAEMHRSGL